MEHARFDWLSLRFHVHDFHHKHSPLDLLPQISFIVSLLPCGCQLRKDERSNLLLHWLAQRQVTSHALFSA